MRWPASGSRRSDQLRLSRCDAALSGKAHSLLNQRTAKADRQLRRCHHPVHDLHLFALLPAQVAVFAQDEEGAEVCAAHERGPGKAQRHEADRSPDERVADGATAPDERGESARWLSTAIDSDAVS